MENILRDIGQINKLTLFYKLFKYDVLVFDLDNTIYSECVFDYYFFESIGKNLYALNSQDMNYFIREALMLKEYSRDYLFDRLNHKYKNKTNKPSVAQLVECYQSFKCDGKLQKYSLFNLIYLCYRLGKTVCIITNGHPLRQKNKIIDLRVNKYLKFIYICHPKKSNCYLKPDPWSILEIKEYYPSKKMVMIGDDLETDGKLASNGNVDFIHFVYPTPSFVKELLQ